MREIQDYVPACFPGQHYGDYVILDIASDGTIKNWPTGALDLSDFEKGNEA